MQFFQKSFLLAFSVGLARITSASPLPDAGCAGGELRTLPPSTGTPPGCVGNWPTAFTIVTPLQVKPGDHWNPTCDRSGGLQVTLENGVLYDRFRRIGGIVANRQFQFDGPSQCGTIYNAGWSICPDNGMTLALGSQRVFVQCAINQEVSNIYDQPIDSMCYQVYMGVSELLPSAC